MDSAWTSGRLAPLMYGLVVCEPIWTGSPADIPLQSAWTSDSHNVWTSGL